MHGRFYEADWIPKKDPPIVLLILDQEAGEREALLYVELSAHPHLIHTFGLVKNDRQSIMLIQERTLHGNLQSLLQNGVFQPSPKVLVKIFLQIVDAMVYIVNKSIVHGNLCCANVLIFEMNASDPAGNRVKLTNFSSARRKDQAVTNDRLSDTSVRYCALEILLNKDGSNYSELSNVFSIGVLMWEACSKDEVPYRHHRSDDDVRRQRVNGEKLRKPKDCPNQLWTAIEHCWLTKLEVRFTFKEMKMELSKIDFP
jgi:serine/threonine protein kinase